MEAKSKSTAPGGARKESWIEGGGWGVKPGGAGCRIVGEERVQFGARFHPLSLKG